MYLSFYRLKHKPFQISTDPSFLWLGEKHEEALATLRYGVQDNKGFLLLTGDVGTGKTTLINALLKTLGKDILVATIRDPALEPIDFFNYTANAFGMEANFTSKASFLIQFERFLLDANKKNKQVLLIIDEAQRINQELLEEVRLLSNIEKEDSKLLNIFFVGQLEFNDILLRHENRAIRQRITVNYNIKALSPQETGHYINHRLEVAGGKNKIHLFKPSKKKIKGEYLTDELEPAEDLEEIFTFEAIQGIYSFSKGYPRLINIICDRCLLTGFVEESPQITLQHVNECVKELTIPQFEQKSDRGQIIPADNEKPETPPPPKTKKIESVHGKLTETENKGFSKNFTFALGILLLFTLSYFVVSINWIPALQGDSIVKFAQGFWQKPDTKTAGRGAEQSNIQIPTQPEPVKTSEATETDRKKNQASITTTEDIVSEPNKVNLHKKSEVETKDASSLKLAPSSKTIKEITKNNQPTVPLKADREPVKTEITPSEDPRANISIPEKQTNNAGEQILPKEIKVESLVTFEKLVIPFPSNSNFPAKSLDSLNILVRALLTHPSYNVIITGFTDSEGNEAFNEKLSEFRANTIKSYLVGKGLRESQIITQGFGSKYPIASNDTYSGRMANRRVEIVIDR